MSAGNAPARFLLLLALALATPAHAGTIQANKPGAVDLDAPAPTPCRNKPIVRDGELVVLDCHGKIIPPPPVDASPTPAAVPSSSDNPSDSSAYNDATQRLALSSIEFNIWTNSYTRSLYIWQSRASIIIFFVVIGLVLAGLYFAWLQFQTTLHLARALPTAHPAPPPIETEAPTPPSPHSGEHAAEDSAPAAADRTEFRIGKDGIVIQSSFVGLIILAMSMGFFILYLKYVYPITPADASPPNAATSQSQGH